MLFTRGLPGGRAEREGEIERGARDRERGRERGREGGRERLGLMFELRTSSLNARSALSCAVLRCAEQVSVCAALSSDLRCAELSSDLRCAEICAALSSEPQRSASFRPALR